MAEKILVAASSVVLEASFSDNERKESLGSPKGRNPERGGGIKKRSVTFSLSFFGQGLAVGNVTAFRMRGNPHLAS